jgi:hypothetical protein
MNVSAAEIERVVREVLAPLVAAPEPKAKPAAKPVSENKPAASPAKTAADPSTVTLSGRVITLSDVTDRLPAMHRLVVSRRAIVTPAVTDLLIRRGIALERVEASEDRSAKLRLSLAAMGIKFDCDPLVGVLAHEGFQADLAAFDCLIKATDHLANEIAKPATLGVLLTKHVAAGLCLANRHARVRAVADASAIAPLGANVLIVDPRELSFFRLKQVVSDFGRGGVRACPKTLSERLA